MMLASSVLFGAILAPMVAGDSLNYSKTVDDPSGDVDNTNIDITKLTSEQDGSDIKFVLTVAGDIKDTTPGVGSYYLYQILVGGDKNIEDDTTLALIVQFVGQSSASYVNYADPMKSGEANYSIEGSKLTMWVPETAFSTFSDYYLMATAVCSTYDESGNLDGLPSVDNTYSWTTDNNDGTDTNDGNNGGDNTGNGAGTPGFEILTLIAAISMAIIILRKRK